MKSVLARLEFLEADAQEYLRRSSTRRTFTEFMALVTDAHPENRQILNAAQDTARAAGRNPDDLRGLLIWGDDDSETPDAIFALRSAVARYCQANLVGLDEFKVIWTRHIPGPDGKPFCRPALIRSGMDHDRPFLLNLVSGYPTEAKETIR